jgi:hypothetical protein
MKALILSAFPAIPQPLFGHGLIGHFGLAKESTWGTAVAATDFAEILSENMTTTLDRFPTRNVHAAFHEPDDHVGAERNGGDVVVMAHPVSVGHFLKGVMNTVSQAAVVSGFLHRTRFITTKSEFADGVPVQPYTLEVFRDVGSSHRYAGALINRLSLSIAPNQELRVTASFLAKSASVIAKTTPTFPGSPTDPFTFDTCSLSLGGSATARIESLAISINNNLEGLLALNASDTIARVRRRGAQEVRISGVLDFIDNAEYDDFVAQTERALVMTVTKTASFQLVVSVPRMVYTAFPTGIGGRDRLTVGFEGMARYLTTSAVALSMELTTTKSNY